MQTLSHDKGQRRHFEHVSTTPSSCIPMQMANMQANSLRSDCWNSPLCPRNMPSNTLTDGMLPPTCGSSTHTAHAHQRRNSISATTEVQIQSPSAISPTSIEQDRPSIKRSRTTDTNADLQDEQSPAFIPISTDISTPTSTPTAGAPPHKEKRLPHHVIERRYRENLNSQIESLRSAVPSTSSCLAPLDMEDIGNATNAATTSSSSSSPSASAFRPLSKAAVIAHAAEYMRQLAAQNEEVERANGELRVTVEALRRLVNCEDCGVVRQIVDAGA